MRIVVVSGIWLAVGLALGCGDDAGTADAGPMPPASSERDAEVAGGRGGQSGRGAGGARAPDAGGAQAPDDGGAAAASCDPPVGSYSASYTQQSGDCGPLSNPFSVPFGSGRSGPMTTVQQFASAHVETEVVIDGCSLRVTQTVSSTAGDLMVRIEAAELAIDAEGVISGSASVTRYDASGEVVCSGVYALELQPASSIIGRPITDAGGLELPDDVQAAIEDDCQNTVQCRAQMGLELPPDPLAACIEDSSALLLMNRLSWANFLERHAACAAFVVCDYVNCVTSQ